MHIDVKLSGFAVLAIGLATTTPAAAASWNGSYESDGSCYCSGALPSSVSEIFVPTPIGSQSVASVCARLGEGPGLNEIGGLFDKTVFPDAQCGNGPFAEGTSLLDESCAGTREPGNGEDCQPVGPRWNLSLAYADKNEAIEESRQLAAAQPTVPADEIVTIEGQQWRMGPAGTQAVGGEPGSRIILDGEVWLKSDDPVFAKTQAKPVRILADAEPPAIAPTRQSRSVQAAAPEDPATLRARQRVLVAEARERARQRKAAGLTPSDSITRTDVPLEPANSEGEQLADTQSLEQGTEPVSIGAATPAEEAPIEAVTEAIDSSQDTAQSDVSPMSALRLPDNARGSSDEFGYVQAMPMTFDFGGGGVQLEGSAELDNQYHFVARGAAANKYRELMIGVGYHYTPPQADRMTLMATVGFEYGVFPLAQGDFEVDATDTGLWLGVGSRIVLNSRFELEGGVGYSSFHEGDPVAFGGAFYHINRNMDLMSRFELGDNDSFGVGLRVYY
jgi:hypothetical protein